MLGHARSDREFDSEAPARSARPGDDRDDPGQLNGSRRPRSVVKLGGRSGGRSKPVGIATEGPYDSEDSTVARLGRTAGRVDFGSLRIPIPARAQLQVEKGTGELLRAVHVLVPSGRVSLSALAAPRSNPLWRGLCGEIADSLSSDGARVRTQWGEWGREVEAGSNGALSRFIGVDGPRWMLYGVATGPADGASELADILREMMRKTVVYRGEDPLPVKTVLPLRLPEHLEENVERARDVSAQRPARSEGGSGAGRSAATGSDRPGRAGAGRSDDTDGSGWPRPAQRTDAARAIGTPGGAAAPLKSPRRPSDPPVRQRPDAAAQDRMAQDRMAQDRMAQDRIAQDRIAQDRMAQNQVPQTGRRPAIDPRYATPPPGQGPARYPGRAIGRAAPFTPTRPGAAPTPPGDVPASVQLPPNRPAIGPLGAAGRPVDRRPPALPSAFPVSGHTDTGAGGLGRDALRDDELEGPSAGEPLLLSGSPYTGVGMDNGYDPAVSGRVPPSSGHTDGIGNGARGGSPAHGSLPPISGHTVTGGFARPSGVESTWSLAAPVVNTDQVSQQPAWALLGDAPSFWPHERYQPGPDDGPIEISSIDSSLPLESVTADPLYGTRDLDGIGSVAADTGRLLEPARDDDRADWVPPEPDSWSSPVDTASDLLGSTDSLHAVLTLDDAVTRDRQARFDRLGRHRSDDV